MTWPGMPPSKLLRGRTASTVILALAVMAFGGLLFALTERGLRFVTGFDAIGPLLAARLLEFLLLGMLGFVFVSALPSCLGVFFLAEDLTLIRSTPVAEPVFFWGRGMQAVVLSVWMPLATVIPVLAAYGMVLHAGWVFILASLTALLLLVMIPVTAALVLVTVLVCVFPARRLRELLLTFGLVGMAVLLLLVRAAQPERLVHPETFGTLASYLAAFDLPSRAWLPSTWAAELLQVALAGRFSLMTAALLCSGAWASSSVAYLIHRRFYRLAYSRSQEGGPGLWRPGCFEAVSVRMLMWLPPAMRALVLKDARQFWRDPAQWSQLLLILLLVATYIYNYTLIPGWGLRLGPVLMTDMLALLNLVLVGLVAAALAARFCFPTLSLEGRALWLLRTAPLSPSRLLWLKAVTSSLALLPVTLTAAGLAAGLLELSAPLLGLTLLHTVAVTFSLASAGVGVGAMFPRFKFESAAQIPLSAGGVLFMIEASLAALIAAALSAWFAAPLVLPNYERPLSASLLIGLLWLTFHILHAIIPLRLGSRVLAAMESV